LRYKELLLVPVFTQGTQRCRLLRAEVQLGYAAAFGREEEAMLRQIGVC
jgi:hypothetical protein